MKCPHCLVAFHESWQSDHIVSDVEGAWRQQNCICPNCSKAIITLERKNDGIRTFAALVRPKAISRAPLSEDVPELYALDYRESCLVLSDSPKASAALSRRCLQALLRDIGGAKKKDLADQIEEIAGSNGLPTYLSRDLDAVRHIGNFAAHPTKSKQSGEIIEVELGEAEWNLDVIEGLFDFYFVQPKVSSKKREELNKKLIEAGKPTLSG